MFLSYMFFQSSPSQTISTLIPPTTNLLHTNIRTQQRNNLLQQHLIRYPFPPTLAFPTKTFISLRFPINITVNILTISVNHHITTITLRKHQRLINSIQLHITDIIRLHNTRTFEIIRNNSPSTHTLLLVAGTISINLQPAQPILMQRIIQQYKRIIQPQNLTIIQYRQRHIRINIRTPHIHKKVNFHPNSIFQAKPPFLTHK